MEILLIFLGMAVIACIVWKAIERFTQEEPIKPPPPPTEDLSRKFTREELKKHDGSSGTSYIGCKGYVFDVSASDFYRKGGAYSIFSGHEASVALAKMSFEQSDLEATDLSKLNYDERDTLDQIGCCSMRGRASLLKPNR